MKIDGLRFKTREFGRLAPLFALCLGISTLCATKSTTADHKVDQSTDLFRDGNIPKIHIEVPEAGMATLRKYRWKWGGNEDERIPVAATVKEGQTIYTNVALRLKGAAGSFRPVDQNPGLTLNFDKWADGQRFHGLQKLSLNNSLQDQTFCSDKFSRELYLKAGVPVPRAGHARVYLNGRDLGLYVLTEGWNKQFLHRFFKNAAGNLYDCGFAGDINSPRMHVNCGDDPTNQLDRAELLQAAKEASKKKSLDPLLPVLDVDRFLRLIVLDALTWNWDGYSIGHNNYRVFHDVDSGKMIFMPHGLDQMFWRPDDPIMPGGKGTIATAVLASSEGRRRYMDVIRQFTGDFFNSTALTERVREISANIEPVLKDIGPATFARQQRAVDQFCNLVIFRCASIRTQLAGSSNLWTMEIGQSRNIAPASWKSQDASADSGGSLHLNSHGNGGPQAAQTTVWLEAGYYRLEGRVRTKGVKISSGEQSSGAGFRVVSLRKPTAGVNWDWFPYRESRDYEVRGEMPSPIGRNDRLIGDSDWKPIAYDFELHQPMADLQFLCELRAEKGEAWFDPDSLRLTRRSPPKVVKP